MGDLLEEVQSLGAGGEWLFGGYGNELGPNGKPGYDCFGLITAGMKKLKCAGKGKLNTSKKGVRSALGSYPELPEYPD